MGPITRRILSSAQVQPIQKLSCGHLISTVITFRHHLTFVSLGKILKKCLFLCKYQKIKWVFSEEESEGVLPSLTVRGCKLIILWCLEPRVLIDNHRTALGLYIARLRQGLAKSTDHCGQWSELDQLLACSHLFKLFMNVSSST